MKYIITLNDKKYEVDVTETEAKIIGVTSASQPAAVIPAAPITAAAPAPAPAPAAAPANAADGTKVKSPMPGTILEVKVTPGQSVKAGDVMFILEAMKMENEVVAPENGTVKQILAGKGTAVESDAILAVI
ncbi:MAG: biotin/lipoyl-binding protein [Oscillospiraceae bacterium]|nr:biotin/lipoyl-binding protein [Oscillospiraceae bacterium]